MEKLDGELGDEEQEELLEALRGGYTDACDIC